MKTKIVLSSLAVMMFSASALATTPASYDTKFNVSANVPDSAHIVTPDGKPVTDVDIELTANGLVGNKMEAKSPLLMLWNNDVNKLDVTLVMDDSQSATGGAFTLYSTQGGVLNSMTYKINTIDGTGTKSFATSGATQDYTLTANGTHGQLPLQWQFVSDADYTALGQGQYTGVVYANVNAKA